MFHFEYCGLEFEIKFVNWKLCQFNLLDYSYS